MTFNLDEQIFLKNDTTSKVYTLTLNQSAQAYDVTREWTIPGQPVLATKTDRFMNFKQAIDFLDLHFKERIANGYIEIMRRTGIKKTSNKIEKHKHVEKIGKQEDGPIAPNLPGLKVEERIMARQITSIHDRIGILKNNKPQ